MINIKNEYKGLLSEILDTGMDKSDRTGTGTKSVFGRTIRHDMSLGFPILTAKKISCQGIYFALIVKKRKCLTNN